MVAMSQPHRIYVGTIGQGLWRSTDGGDSFVRASDGLFVECHVRALAVHPRDPRTLYLGSEQGLFRSRDGADSWERVESPLNGMQLWSILLLPHNPEVILVGTCPARLFRSADGGRTWSELTVQMARECPRIMYSRVTTLIADPDEPDALWAGIEIDGLRRSTDGGRTWEAVGQHGISSLDIHALAIVPDGGQGKRLLAATNNDLNLSTDEGQTWRPLHIGQSLPWSYCRALAQPAGRPQEVLLGNGNGPPGSAGVIGRSTDGGQSWETASMPGLANSTIWNFAVHPADPQRLYASSISGELYASTTGGASWEKLPREFGEIRALAWTPS
jgi:photosystem II stability/assembly factor-like uncharacterized protein